MSISNFGELKTAVANWLTRSELTPRIPEFVALGEARLFTDLRCREMEATANIVLTAAQRADPLPTRFVQARSLYLAGTPNVRLEYRSPAEYWSVYADIPTAAPEYYTIEQEDFLWGPVPDATPTVTIAHYARPAAFSSDADTNAIIARWPSLYLYTALLESAPFLGNDPRIVTWSGLYETLLASIHQADKRDRYSGDVIVPDRDAQLT